MDILRSPQSQVFGIIAIGRLEGNQAEPRYDSLVGIGMIESILVSFQFFGLFWTGLIMAGTPQQ